MGHHRNELGHHTHAQDKEDQMGMLSEGLWMEDEGDYFPSCPIKMWQSLKSISKQNEISYFSYLLSIG